MGFSTSSNIAGSTGTGASIAGVFLQEFVKDTKCPDCNLVEVMCCEAGCVGGNATLNLPRIARKQLKTLLDESQDLKRED